MNWALQNYVPQPAALWEFFFALNIVYSLMILTTALVFEHCGATWCQRVSIKKLHQVPNWLMAICGITFLSILYPAFPLFGKFLFTLSGAPLSAIIIAEVFFIYSLIISAKLVFYPSLQTA